MGTWLREKWPELVILGLLLPGALLLYDINTRLTRVEERQVGIERRIDGISSALPDIRVRVAYEAIYGPISSAVLVTEPSQDAAGSWGIDVRLLNAITGNVLLYRAVAGGPQDLSAIYAVAGWIRSVDSGAIALSDIERFGMEIEQPTFIPANLRREVSAISHLKAAEFVNSGAIKQIDLREIGTVSYPPMRNWDDLSKYLQSADWQRLP